MNFDELKNYCLEKLFVVQDFPFGATPAVFKVRGKIFALLAADGEITSISLKCDPELAVHLRLEHLEIIPGYHLNKKHWNTVTDTKRLSEETLKWLIDMSYELICFSKAKKTTKTAR